MSDRPPGPSGNGKQGRRSNGHQPRSPADTAQTVLNEDQTALDADQTASDADQTAADSDHTTADTDQAISDRDAVLARTDQKASDRDQKASDRDLSHDPQDESLRLVHDASPAERELSAAKRVSVSRLRGEATADRFDTAARRDETARLRDIAAEARDRAAAVRDRLAPAAPGGANERAQAAADRARAAKDRERAAADRKQAAIDREQARRALLESHVDELTGTYRRGVGRIALQGEISRARRSDGRLVLAFVDVDRLKQFNDREGHAAGDRLLIDVVSTIRSKLRSYDPVVRYGGDEFVCTLAEADLADARLRFDQIQAILGKVREGCSISVGLARLEPGDSLNDLTERADAALYEAKVAIRAAAISAEGGEPGDTA
jgi:diguanylate cyclase (GGDEF)-like protein